MAKKQIRDPLLTAIEEDLMPGRFVRYADMFDFTRHLHQVEEKIAALPPARPIS